MLAVPAIGMILNQGYKMTILNSLLLRLKKSPRLTPIKKFVQRRRERFLKDVFGVVHIGANSGQERELYNSYGVNVVWVEPIPDIFETLQNNIRNYPKQKAYKELITDVNGKNYEFNIANNNGASSSILDFKEHKELFPDVQYGSKVNLTSITLTKLFEQENIPLDNYQALIMDTQGSELLVLKGAIPILNAFTFIKLEVPDFEAYKDCCQVIDVEAFMKENGFAEVSRNEFAGNRGSGKYYDILYKRV